ncbi:hypothetical protein [uncultured Ferrovibrio sp.]|jgi:hypothetical protein|uniref:hypothetical protein n=1 Tax=uncultured Ferrovibrio sp. TaxID=1576913 RepID=UPI0026234C52|nr:hypothetical protein [uncultured Ferrovibrio sp.]
MDKDVGLRIRVQRELREQFVAACRAEDKPAAQVIREFMRSYVSDQKQSRKSSPTRPIRNRWGRMAIKKSEI